MNEPTRRQVYLPIKSYEILKEMAEADCRSMGQTVAWLLLKEQKARSSPVSEGAATSDA